MKFKEFEIHLSLPVFTVIQARKIYPGRPQELLIQLSRWVKSGYLNRLKRGIYRFSDQPIDEFTLAGYLYSPSYISLETALNNLGIIPDVSLKVTSVSPTTTKTIKTVQGSFLYAKIQPALWFGWQTVNDSHGFPYKIALPEKALLDWIYLRKIRDLLAQRVDLSNLSKTKLKRFARQFPAWARKVIDE